LKEQLLAYRHDDFPWGDVIIGCLLVAGTMEISR